MYKIRDNVIGIIGLGYVGLPLAIASGKLYQTLGYDISEQKIEDYRNHLDNTGEVSSKEFKNSKKIIFTSNYNDLRRANIFIIAVPTPIDKGNIPNLSPLKNACITVGKIMKKDSIIIFEPTVYPGATEEFCIPILEKISHMKWKQDFNIAYSPERINPGDKINKLTNIVKVISADNKETLDIIDRFYSSIIKAGTFRAPSIKVAEAAKVIENTQRDVNVALINEFSMIFEMLDVDTKEVLDVASSKWNFLNFSPGLVGGHCIGVDPYYLTYKAEVEGYHPQLILSGRRINDGMPEYLAKKIIKKIINAKINISKAKILVLGITFKENCSDLRNSKVIELVKELKNYNCQIEVHDPLANKIQVSNYDINLNSWKELKGFDVIVAAVSHEFYLKKPINEILNKFNDNGFFIDIKSSYPKKEIIQAGYNFWRL